MCGVRERHRTAQLRPLFPYNYSISSDIPGAFGVHIPLVVVNQELYARLSTRSHEQINFFCLFF